MRLPATVPDKVLNLAIELTATEATPYDRVVAIERYLRKIPYDLNVSIGPAGADIVEYFLFQLERGYCDYYASAMVVLSRAAGIPARYVSGYIAETYNGIDGSYIVTADQAHAWAEVFFPGLGWVIFEPTGGRSAMERPQEPIADLPETFSFDFAPLVPETEFSWGKFLGILVGGIFGFLLISVLAFLISDWWVARRPADVQLNKIYKRIYRFGRWSGVEFGTGDTAYQFANKITTSIQRFGKESYWERWFLEGVEKVNEITSLFVQHLFNPYHEQVDPQEIFGLFKVLRPRLWFLVILTKAYPYRILQLFLWENRPLVIPLSMEENK